MGAGEETHGKSFLAVAADPQALTLAKRSSGKEVAAELVTKDGLLSVPWTARLRSLPRYACPAREETLPKQRGGEFDDEPRVRRQVPPPETPRFVAEPVQPLQAPGLHPLRRRPPLASVKIEGGPHVDQHGA